VLTGGAYETGHTGTVVKFNGDGDYGEVSVPISQSFTASIWARSGQSDSWSDSGVLFSARPANGFIIHSESSSEEWSGYVLDSVDDSYHQIGSKFSVSDITAWHMYTVTYDHGTGVGKTFLDGVELGSETFSIERNADTITARFGRDTSDLGERYLYGWLNDARIYSLPLSATQVSKLYEATR
jgi:hypothetical protein